MRNSLHCQRPFFTDQFSNEDEKNANARIALFHSLIVYTLLILSVTCLHLLKIHISSGIS